MCHRLTLLEVFGDDVGTHILRIFSLMRLQRYWKYRFSLFSQEELKARAHFLTLFTCHVPSLSARVNWDEGILPMKNRKIGHLEITTVYNIIGNNYHICIASSYMIIWCAVDYVGRRVYVEEKNDKFTHDQNTLTLT